MVRISPHFPEKSTFGPKYSKNSAKKAMVVVKGELLERDNFFLGPIPCFHLSKYHTVNVEIFALYIFLRKSRYLSAKIYTL